MENLSSVVFFGGLSSDDIVEAGMLLLLPDTGFSDAKAKVLIAIMCKAREELVRERKEREGLGREEGREEGRKRGQR